jgi:outer membrane cobalamin receptor
MKSSLLLLCLFAIPSMAQTTISGKVIDEKGEPVPGANVSIKDSYDGTSSLLDGVFTFKSDETGSRILLASFIGYKINEIEVVLTGAPVLLTITLREEINQLDAVTISAGSFTAGEEKRRTILKAVDIATTAGATADIAGALNTLPGTTKVGESGRLFVRGGDSNETRTFIDGMAVLEAYSPSAVNTPSRGRFLPFMFKGTSFSTGGYSAEYGQALSSALVLTSKDKAEMNQTDFGILSVGADVAHTQVWDRSSASAKIQYTNIRPYFGLINQRIDWNTAPASIDGTAVFRQQVGVDGLLKVFGNFSHSNYSLYNHDILDPSKKQLVELTNNYAYGNTAYRQSLGEKWSMRCGLSYNYNSNLYHVDGSPAEEVERGIHSKLVFENSLSDKVEIRFGAETLARDYTASRQDEKSPEILTQSFRETIAGSFLEAEAYANKHFVVKAGVRGEYNSLLHAFSADPRISLAYRPGNKGQFAFAYGTFRQSARNLYLRANHLLSNEKADHFILNYQLLSNNRTFRIETYYKKYYDLVKFENGDPNILTNDGNGYARGVELFFRDNQSFRNVDYWISYSFLDTKRDYLSFPGLATPSFASLHNFSFVYKHFVSKIKSQLGFTYSYSSGRPYYNPNNPSFNSDQTPSYHDLSANVAYLPKNWLIFYVSVTNLLGRDNVFGYNYSATPGFDGQYASNAIRQPALRFVFVGLFITISRNKSVNQLPNL